MNWLDRRISRPGPYLALCLKEADFREAMSRLKAPEIPKWINAGADATMHTFTHESRGLCCIVCLGEHGSRSAVEVAGMLIHEAVHVWQQWCSDVGEHAPGSEQEAYAVQAIAQELLAEYARHIKRRGNRP